MTTNPKEKLRKVVVAIDGSETSTAALEWAAEEARERSARLVVVHAWMIPSTAYNASLPTALVATVPDLALYKRGAEGVVERALASIDVTSVSQGVETVVARGSAPEVIIAASQEADLLVVGSRGRSGLGQLLLGSVSQAVVRNAGVPVVVVPPRRKAAAAA